MGCLSHAPNWGPGPQPRHVPRPGIEPMTFWFTGWHSIHWATLARMTTIFFRGKFKVLFIIFKDVPEMPARGVTFQALEIGLDWSIHILRRFFLKQPFNWMNTDRLRDFSIAIEKRLKIPSTIVSKLTVADLIFPKMVSRISKSYLLF